MKNFKDRTLASLSDMGNIAQFVSFSPGDEPAQRFARVRGYPTDHDFRSVRQATQHLLRAVPESRVNVRSFHPDADKGREFLYGLDNAADVTAAVRRLGGQGLHTIVNETIDIHDGGVSGVALGGILEFAPDDTPRGVEKSGTMSLPTDLGRTLLTTVYGFIPALDLAGDCRLEFSIHPLRRGFRHDHTILWELENTGSLALEKDIGDWPNNFSRMIGDKAFGLLLAHLLNLPVPTTLVLPRRLAPFKFGQTTGTRESWIRTCPSEQVPGHFTTNHGWLDPFRLLSLEDPDGDKLASVLVQEGVEAIYSGAVAETSDGSRIIEGVRGVGAAFMQGKAVPEELPPEVLACVHSLCEQATSHLGPVRMEWAFDGTKAWVLQLHRGAIATSGRTIYPGVASTYRQFEVSKGIEALRSLIQDLRGNEEGVVLIGSIGVTSHFGDLLRKARIPSYLVDRSCSSPNVRCVDGVKVAPAK